METLDASPEFFCSYIQLPEAFYQRVFPTPVKAPQLVIWNQALSESLGLPFHHWTEDARCQFFAGNKTLPEIQPIALAYAGHQFGQFTMLGDGRAILAGEFKDKKGERFDLQWKGSGITPFSRRGDGRGTLSSMLREYLISEAIHYLGIPGTRTLAVVSTGEPVYRERVHPGGILMRVARSHIRFGTFEFARQWLPETSLKKLFEYTAMRHCPECLHAEVPALHFLESVMKSQIRLVCEWMRVGFIHGVMNTDNMAVSGETIDFGPCAFMNRYNPETVYSYIDEQGRYSFGRQPGILRWNLSVLAGTLLPLISEKEQVAAAAAGECLERFHRLFQQEWMNMMAEKTGINPELPEFPEVIRELLDWMHKAGVDYTGCFRALTYGEKYAAQPEIALPIDWLKKWEQVRRADWQDRMRAANPVYIPRNFFVEQALSDFENGNSESLKNMLQKIRNPYAIENMSEHPEVPTPEQEQQYNTFCGT